MFANASYSDVRTGSNLFTSVRGDIIAPLILKIALSDTSLSSKAVLYSILARTCLNLNRHEEALTYRNRAIYLVAKSLKSGVEPKVAFENIVANMLLATYEVLYQ
jgi:hypothetical protein